MLTPLLVMLGMMAPLFAGEVTLDLSAPPGEQKQISAFIPGAGDSLMLDAGKLGGRFTAIAYNSGDPSATVPMGKTRVACRPRGGWKEGLTVVTAVLKVGATASTYTLYIAHTRKPIQVVTWKNSNTSISDTPFFPLGIYAVNESAMKDVSKFGFNLIQSYQEKTGVTPLKSLLAWCDAARKNHLKVMCHIGDDQVRTLDYPGIAKYVTAIMTHPALFCYYSADEPDLSKMTPLMTEKVKSFIEGLDPYHPVIMTTWDLPKYYAGMDLEMQQCYHGYPAGVASSYQRHRLATAHFGIESAAILNTHDQVFDRKPEAPNAGNSAGQFYKKLTPGTPEWAKAERRARLVATHLAKPPFPFLPGFPKGERFRSCAYTAIAKGSPGLLWWLWMSSDSWSGNARWSYYTVFQHPETLRVARQTLDELNQLKSLVQDPAVNSISWEEDGMLFWSRSLRQTSILIAVNLTTNSRSSAAFTLRDWKGGKSASARVVSENRWVDIVDGKLTDQWPPETTHVYLTVTK